VQSEGAWKHRSGARQYHLVRRDHQQGPDEDRNAGQQAERLDDQQDHSGGTIAEPDHEPVERHLWCRRLAKQFGEYHRGWLAHDRPGHAKRSSIQGYRI
jgi:hypothetical protein